MPEPMAVRSGIDMRQLGLVSVICAAILWGVSGTVAQRLFQAGWFTPSALVGLRMTVAGLLLLAGAGVGRRGQVWAVWASRDDALRLLLFAVAGLFGVQYTYFAAIHAGNAAAATFLQYVGPVLIALWSALSARRWPGRRIGAAVALAIAGSFLLTTGGRPGHLDIPLAGVLWGLASAVTMAFYTVYPAPLLRRYDSAVITGWAMLMGGLCAGCLRPWRGVHTALPQAWLWALFVVVLGTLVPFWLYLMSLRWITPTETGLTACLEPLSAALASVLWLHLPVTAGLVAGGACILATLVLLARPSTDGSGPGGAAP